MKAKDMPASLEAQAVMPFTHGMTREECRLPSCPKCGAWSAYLCFHDYTCHNGRKRPGTRIHRPRINKAVQLRQERRI